MTLSLLLSCFLVCGIAHAIFIPKHSDLQKFNGKSDYVLVASSGRSGSTMMTDQLYKFIPRKNVLKTHLLPPSTKFKGKIIFIFSNPDHAAESALFMMLHKRGFAQHHFIHMETADRNWFFRKLGNRVRNQTVENNLLSYDALGTAEHLQIWLNDRVAPASPEQAQIFAVKYENLWEAEVLSALRTFLGVPEFELPAWRPRGHKNLTPQEVAFRDAHNLGTDDEPVYAAYDEAREIWQQAPAYQFFNIAR